ncbi:MAG: hypothetical protein AAF639_47030 [Chloroflexota bacterium]
MNQQKTQNDQNLLHISSRKKHYNRLSQIYHFYAQINLAKHYPTTCETMLRGWRLWRKVLATRFLPKLNSDSWRTGTWHTNQWRKIPSSVTPRVKSPLMRTAISGALSATMLLASAAPSLQAATITVNSVTINNSDSQCNLVDAIYTATYDDNSDGECATPGSGADTIVFDPAVFTGSTDTITLDTPFVNPNGNGDNGLPTIDSAITINASNINSGSGITIGGG